MELNKLYHGPGLGFKDTHRDDFPSLKCKIGIGILSSSENTHIVSLTCRVVDAIVGKKKQIPDITQIFPPLIEIIN